MQQTTNVLDFLLAGRLPETLVDCLPEYTMPTPRRKTVSQLEEEQAAKAIYAILERDQQRELEV